MTTSPLRRATPEEYLAFENASAGKHEYVNGEIYAMSGGSLEHAMVSGSAIELLNRTFRPGCVALTSDMRLRVVETDMYTYPDVALVCGRPELDPRDRHGLLNPSVLVEVLSPSTEGYDRGAKFAHYRHIPSLRHYVLVDPVARRVEVFTRTDEPTWTVEFAEGEGATFGLLGKRLPVGDLWLGLDLIGG